MGVLGGRPPAKHLQSQVQARNVRGDSGRFEAMRAEPLWWPSAAIRSPFHQTTSAIHDEPIQHLEKSLLRQQGWPRPNVRLLGAGGGSWGDEREERHYRVDPIPHSTTIGPVGKAVSYTHLTLPTTVRV